MGDSEATKKRKAEVGETGPTKTVTKVVPQTTGIPMVKSGAVPMDIDKTDPAKDDKEKKVDLPSLQVDIVSLVPGLKSIALDLRSVTIKPDQEKTLVPLVNGAIDLDSLLLEGLDKLAGNKVDTPDYVTLLKDGLHRSLLLRAIPGSGKTRAILETLSVRCGLYLAATVSRRNGSGALVAATTDCELALSRVQDRDGSDDKERFQAVAPFLACLLLSYLLVWQHLKKEKKDLTPHQWLLLQLYPVKFAETGRDFFLDVYEHVKGVFKRSNPQDLLTDLVLSLHPVGAPRENFTSFPSLCVIDEAQELLEIDTAASPFNTSNEMRILPHLMTLFHEKTFLQYIIAGTSASLRVVVHSRLKSLTGKDKELAEIKRSAKIVDQDTMQKYITKFFNEDIAKSILAIPNLTKALYGRPRILAGFVQHLLAAWSRRKDLKEQVRDALDALIEFWKEKITYIFRTWPAAREKEKHLIYETVASYYYFGQPLVFYGKTAYLLDTGFFDFGIQSKGNAYDMSRLKIGDGEKDIVIAGDGKSYERSEIGMEPVIIQALIKVAVPLFEPFEQIIADDSRKGGYNFESACAMMLRDRLLKDQPPEPQTFKEVFNLSRTDMKVRTEPFVEKKKGGDRTYKEFWDDQPNYNRKDHGTFLPEFWSLPFVVADPGVIGAPLVASSAKLSLSEFLEKPGSVFYSPGTNFGADLVFFLRFIPADGKTTFDVPVFLQAKLTPSYGNDADYLEDALLKTDPLIMNAFSPTTSKNVLKEMKTIAGVLDKKEYSYWTRGSIRIIFRVARLPAMETTVSPVPLVYLDRTPAPRKITVPDPTQKDPENTKDMDVPQTLVIYLERAQLLSCFNSSFLKNALDAIDSRKEGRDS